MKIPKSGFYFRASEEIRCTLEVLQEMTGNTMTEILESCVRIGKKSVAKSRGLNYAEVLYNINAKRKACKLNRWKTIENEDLSVNFEDEIEIAKTKWTED